VAKGRRKGIRKLGEVKPRVIRAAKVRGKKVQTCFGRPCVRGLVQKANGASLSGKNGGTLRGENDAIVRPSGGTRLMPERAELGFPGRQQNAKAVLKKLYEEQEHRREERKVE